MGSEVDIEDVISKIEELLPDNPYILPTLGNLAQSNFLIQELPQLKDKFGR